jgi:WD40 repeat protein
MRKPLIACVLTIFACKAPGTTGPRLVSADGTEATTVVQQSPTSPIDAIVFAPSGSRLAVFANDGHVRMYDVASRSLLSATRYGSYLGGGLTFASAVWNRDDRLSVSGTNGGAVLDLDGHALGTFPSQLQQLRVTTDGSILGVANNTIRHIGTRSYRGRIDLNIANTGSTTVATTPDGKLAAWLAGLLASDEIHVGEIERLPRFYPVKLGFDAGALAITADGKTAFVGSKDSLADETPATLFEVSILNAPSHPPIRLVEGEGSFRAAAISADQRYVAAASDALVVWDRTSRKSWRRKAVELDGQRNRDRGWFQHVAFSADSRWLAASTASTVHIFELATGRYMGALGEDVRGSHLVELLDDNRLVSSTNVGLTEWNLRDGTIVRRHSLSTPSAVRVNPGTLRLVTAADCGQWKLGMRLSTATLDGDDVEEEMDAREYCFPTGLRDAETRGAISTSQWVAYTRLANDRDDTELVLQGLDDGIVRALPDSANARQFMFSPDGRTIAALVGDFPQQAAVWDVASGRPTIIAKPRRTWGLISTVRPFAFSPDSARVAFIDGARLWIWNISTKRMEVDAFAPLGEKPALSVVAFAPDNETWVVASDRSAVVVGRGSSILTQRQPLELGPVSVAIRGERIALAMSDGGIRILDASSLAELAAFVEFEDDEDVAVTPQGAFRGTTEAAQRVALVYSSPVEVFRLDRMSSRLHDPATVARVLSGNALPSEPREARPPRIVQKSAATLDGTRASLRILAPRAARVRVFGEGQQLLDQACAGACTIRFDTVPGVKRYQVVAFDPSQRSSNPLEVVLPEKRPTSSALWLLAAGVADYPKLEGFDLLRSADADACEIASVFTSLTDMRVQEATTLINGAVTTEAVLHALRRFERMEPADLAVLFFSGHAVRGPDGESIFLTSGVEAHDGVPTAGSAEQHGIRWSALAEPLRRLRGRVLILLDMCHSGGFGQSQIVASSELADELNKDGRSGVVVFASSKGRQRSAEYATKTKSNGATSCSALPKDPAVGGAFRRAIVTVLRTISDYDLDGDGLRVSELVDAVSRRVHGDSNGLQTPWVARRETFADFLLMPPGATP